MIKTIKRYTLVELLIVIGIMAVLMGIALPAFTKMAKGNGITVAERNLSAKINGARSYAITNRVYVALIFITSDSNAPDKLRYVSYRPAIVTFSGGNYTFKKWIDSENWESMPGGTVYGGEKGTATPIPVGANFSSTYASSASAAGTTGTTVLACDFQDVNGATSATSISIINCLVFKPFGNTASAAEFTMWIWEATLPSVGSSVQPVVTNSSNFVKLTVNPFTGKVKYSSL